MVLVLGLGLGLSAQMQSDVEAQFNDSQAIGEAGAGFTTIGSPQLATMLKNKDFFFVNVHIPYQGEIEGTDAFIAYDRIDENLNELPSDKNEKIVLYCLGGPMSLVAAAELSRRGYTQVSHLHGGMFGWTKIGNRVVEK